MLVAVADPTNVMTSDDLRLAFGSQLRFVVSEDEDLERAIRRVYRKQVEFVEDGTDLREALADRRSSRRSPSDDLGQRERRPRRSRSSTRRSPRRSRKAPPTSTSSPASDELVVRARIDGVMRQLMHDAEDRCRPASRTRLKILGELDIAERRAPQDGRFAVALRRQRRRPPHRGHADDPRRAGRAPDAAPRRPRSASSSSAWRRTPRRTSRARSGSRTARSSSAARPAAARRRRCTARCTC